MSSFPALTSLFVQKSSCLYNKKKVTLWLVFSRGKKQYFIHSMHSIVKYCFYHSKIKFISLRRRVISSIDHQSLGEGGGTWVNFCWVCAAGLSEPLPHYSVFSSQFIIDPMLVSHFCENIPQIPTCQNLLTPEILQMCDSILVTLLAPIENATPL